MIGNRQYIPNPTPLRKYHCGECHVLLSNDSEGQYFCQVCQFLFDLMCANPYFVECHRVWSLSRAMGGARDDDSGIEE